VKGLSKYSGVPDAEVTGNCCRKQKGQSQPMFLGTCLRSSIGNPSIASVMIFKDLGKNQIM
jgi:hypothetical protein